jgi:hypothetical protein
VNVGHALDAVVSTITGQPHTTSGLLAGRTAQSAHLFSVKTGPVSVGEALDAILRAHGHAGWEVRLGIVRPNQLGPLLWIRTHDGSGLSAPVAVPPR